MKFKNVILKYFLISGIIICVVIVVLTVYLCLYNNCTVEEISLPYIFIVWGFLPFVLYLIWKSKENNEPPTDKTYGIWNIIPVLGILFSLFIVVFIQFIFTIISLMELLAHTLGWIIPIALIYLVGVISSRKKNQSS